MRNFFRKLAIMLAAVLLISSLSVGSVSAATPKLNKTKLTLNVKKSYQLKLNNNSKKIKWYSSKKSVATVSNKGKVTAKKKGTANITAKVGSNKYTCRVTVKQPVTSLKMNKKSYTLKKKGSTVTLKSLAYPSSASNKSVTWKSSNKNVATVSSKGKVTAVGNGKATITATANDGSRKKTSCKITVKIPSVTAKKVSLSKSSVSLTKKGQTYTLKASFSPSNTTNKSVTWESSNAKVATVNSSGRITAVGNGSATITATAKDRSKKKASCKVTVKIAIAPKPVAPVKVSSVSLNKTSLKLTENGQSVTLSASVSPSNAANKSLSWSSSNTSVATVNASGYVTAASNGSATITVTAKDGSGKRASCKVTVAIPKPADPETPQTEPEKPIVHVNSVIIGPYSSLQFTQKGETSALTAYVIPSNATNTSVRWRSSNTSVATVNSNGLVTAVGNGDTIITLTSVDGGKTATCSVSVNIPEQKPDPEPEKPPVGPSKPAVENLSFAGGDGTICGFKEGDVASNVNIREITFETQGNIGCIDYYEGYWNGMQTAQFTGLKRGNVKIIAKYKGATLKTWNITITSDWDVYMRYENWKNGVKREICPSGNATVETLDALRNYIVNNFSYSMDSPGASNKYYAWEYMKCDCFGAAGMFGDIASDLGFKVSYVNGAGTIYEYMADAVSNSAGHISNAVNINGSWKYYDATPY